MLIVEKEDGVRFPMRYSDISKKAVTFTAQPKLKKAAIKKPINNQIKTLFE